MKVLITGATGWIGRSLVKQLAKAEHELIVLSRSPESAQFKFPVPVRVLKWDSSSPLISGLREQAPVDAVIHLAGESIAEGRWTHKKKEKIRNSRVEGTRNLILGLKEAGIHPRVFVSASAVGIYGDRGNEILTEESKIGSDFLAKVCRDWEDEAFQAEKVFENCRTVALRTGIVLSEGGGALKSMLPVFRAGLGGKLGGGRQWMSWIHLDDVVRAYIWAINDEHVRGAYNLVAPNPVRNREFTSALGEALHKPAFFRVPRIILRIVLGQVSQALLASQRVSSDRLMRAMMDSQVSFQFFALKPALKEILAKPRLSGESQKRLVA